MGAGQQGFFKLRLQTVRYPSYEFLAAASIAVFLPLSPLGDRGSGGEVHMVWVSEPLITRPMSPCSPNGIGSHRRC